MTSHIIIRPYSQEDAPFLAEIYYHTIRKVNLQDYSQKQVEAWAPDPDQSPIDWQEKFQKTQPLVALIGGLVVSFVEFEPDGHIDCFYCHHKHLRQGVGTALMDAILEKAASTGVQRIFAEVSITARPFFERHGFQILKEQLVSLRGVELRNYKMEKNLSL